MKDEQRDRRLLAERIARRLFTNGAKQVAERIILSKGGQDLGGWSFGPVVDQIDAELARKPEVSR